MQQQIKALYTEANTLYQQAQGILGEFAGKELPAEKATQVDTLLNQVEAKTQSAKRLERAAGMGQQFNEPATQLPFGGGGDAPAGKAFGAGVSPEVKVLAQMAGYDDPRIKASAFRLEESGRYDPDRALKHAIGTDLLWRYGEKGIDAALMQLPAELKKHAAEIKALATSPGAAGGYLVAEHQRGVFLETLADLMVMRRIANVLPPIPGGSTITPAEDSELTDATWTSEVLTGSEDTVNPFGQRSLTPHPLAKSIKISRTLLRAGTLMDAENYILSRGARKIEEPQENAFINGTGAQQPLGLLTHGSISSTETANSLSLVGDDIVNWVYTLDARYMRRAQIICNQSFIRKVRLLKDSNGQYLWQPGLQQGLPSMILDFPYNLSTSYPTGLSSDAFTANSLVATIGDFFFYWIVDSLNLEVQRVEELSAATNQVGFFFRAETDGAPVKADAFRHLKIKA